MPKSRKPSKESRRISTGVRSSSIKPCPINSPSLVTSSSGKQRDKQINVRLSQRELAELRKTAQERQCSVSELVREGIGLPS